MIDPSRAATKQIKDSEPKIRWNRQVLEVLRGASSFVVSICRAELASESAMFSSLRCFSGDSGRDGSIEQEELL